MAACAHVARRTRVAAPAPGTTGGVRCAWRCCHLVDKVAPWQRRLEGNVGLQPSGRNWVVGADGTSLSRISRWGRRQAARRDQPALALRLKCSLGGVRSEELLTVALEQWRGWGWGGRVLPGRPFFGPSVLRKVAWLGSLEENLPRVLGEPQKTRRRGPGQGPARPCCAMQGPRPGRWAPVGTERFWAPGNCASALRVCPVGAGGLAGQGPSDGASLPRPLLACCSPGLRPALPEPSSRADPGSRSRGGGVPLHRHLDSPAEAGPGSCPAGGKALTALRRSSSGRLRESPRGGGWGRWRVLCPPPAQPFAVAGKAPLLPTLGSGSPTSGRGPAASCENPHPPPPPSSIMGIELVHCQRHMRRAVSCRGAGNAPEQPGVLCEVPAPTPPQTSGSLPQGPVAQARRRHLLAEEARRGPVVGVWMRALRLRPSCSPRSLLLD